MNTLPKILKDMQRQQRQNQLGHDHMAAQVCRRCQTSGNKLVILHSALDNASNWAIGNGMKRCPKNCTILQPTDRREWIDSQKTAWSLPSANGKVADSQHYMERSSQQQKCTQIIGRNMAGKNNESIWNFQGVSHQCSSAGDMLDIFNEQSIV